MNEFKTPRFFIVLIFIATTSLAWLVLDKMDTTQYLGSMVAIFTWWGYRKHVANKQSKNG